MIELEERPDLSANTMRTYRTQWEWWQLWASDRGVEVLPADPARVAEYLAERHSVHGHRPATLSVAAAAIAHAHADRDLVDPCSHPVVKRMLKGIRRTAGTAQRQANGLLAEHVDAIQSSALIRRVMRPTRGDTIRTESRETARRRGLVDIAMVLVMRDGLLRAGEAAALCWGDLTGISDGSGRLLIRRSKTDPTGNGSVVFLSAPAMAALRVIRGFVDAEPDNSIFGLDSKNISRRITEAAEQAGLGSGFSGHSPRVGMAQDLARNGVDLPALMTAGRWKSPTMPAHYIRNESADRGAVAQYHGYRRGAAREW